MSSNNPCQQYTVQWIETHIGGVKWCRYFFLTQEQKDVFEKVFASIEPVVKTMPKVSGTRFSYKISALTPEQNRRLINMCSRSQIIEGKPQHAFCSVDMKRFTELEGKTYDYIYEKLHDLRWLDSKYQRFPSQTLTTLLGSPARKPTQTARRTPRVEHNLAHSQ